MLRTDFCDVSVFCFIMGYNHITRHRRDNQVVIVNYVPSTSDYQVTILVMQKNDNKNSQLLTTFNWRSFSQYYHTDSLAGKMTHLMILEAHQLGYQNCNFFFSGEQNTNENRLDKFKISQILSADSRKWLVSFPQHT